MSTMSGDRQGDRVGVGEGAGWRFLTNHANVLLCLAADPALRVRDVAEAVGITERSTLRILRDLEADGYLVRTRAGARTTYALRREGPLRHPLWASHDVNGLLELLAGPRDDPGAARG